MNRNDIWYTANEKLQIVSGNFYEMLRTREIITEKQKTKLVKQLNEIIIDSKKVGKIISQKIKIGDPKTKCDDILLIILDKAMTATNLSKEVPFNNYDEKKIIITPDVKPFKQYLLKEGFEIFELSYFMINIIKYFMQPEKIIILSEEEKKQLLKDYNCKLKDLPKITKNDPLTQYFNLKVDDVLKMVRNTDSSGIYVSYRVVVGYMMGTESSR
jgi:DNA-directed RNA polymerase subunit H (RpoH/RPB5)